MSIVHVGTPEAARGLDSHLLPESPIGSRARGWPGETPTLRLSDLAPALLEVVGQAAVASAQTMGQGDRDLADAAAVSAMRDCLDAVPIDGRIVIGEGERDRAPMLYIGERVGAASSNGEARFPEVDIAVYPLEGTNLCATGEPNSIAVIAASERGGLLHAPDIYMDKLVVGPRAKAAVDLDAPVGENLRAIASSLGRKVTDLVIVVLDRPRHEHLIASVRSAGSRIRLIGDGDLSASISAALMGSGVHAVMGVGGAPEGVLTAAAMRCLNGEIFGRLVVDSPEQEARIREMGIEDPKRVCRAAELAIGDQLVFAASGVADGTFMNGLRFFGEGARTSSIVLQLLPRKVNFVESIHLRPNLPTNASVRF